MIYGAVAAGGTGSRMGADIPKQFLEINSVPIIIRTIRKMVEKTDRVFVGVVSEWFDYTCDLVEKFKLSEKVTVVKGGSNRMETLYRIVLEIEAESLVSDEDILITHDAVRPFINNRILEEGIEKCRVFGASGTFVPAVDTIAVSMDGATLYNVPKRENMYITQTPQTVKLKLLKNVLEENVCRFEEFTDVCGMLNVLGFKVGFVHGEYTNIKITNPGDLVIARGILGELNDENR